MLRIVIIVFTLFLSAPARAQVADSSLDNLYQISTKYVSDLDKKIEKYSNRISTKTEKTLSKLSRWETKIQGLLQRVNPEAANRLFGDNRLTFTSLLQKVRVGESIAIQYKAPYNKYRDDVATSLKYLSQQKEFVDSGIIKKVIKTSSKMKELSTDEDKSEALQQFIKERKKELLEQAYQYIGKSKYFTKINKEAFYYTETLKNYKELFRDSKKAEETAKTILNKIPAFQRFCQSNSQLASVFSQPGDVASANITGLQTRASVQNLIQNRIASGGPNAMQEMRQNIQDAKAQMSQLKGKLLDKVTGGNSSGEMPDFKPNMQKTKTFLQRLEYDYNLQFAKNNNLLPATADIGLMMGYKINDKSVIGAGASYKLGIGSIRHIELNQQGIGLRSFIDWKLKKQFFISGGYEMNYNTQFKNFTQLNEYDPWQRSALIGLAKKISIKTKLFKSTNLQLLYDILSREHTPTSQPIIFRTGYVF